MRAPTDHLGFEIAMRIVSGVPKFSWGSVDGEKQGKWLGSWREAFQDACCVLGLKARVEDYDVRW